MDDSIRLKIANKVHDEHAWKVDEVRVDEVENLRHGSCSFYTAGHNVRPLSYQLNYALLSGDTILSVSDNGAVSRILDACGADAPAAWWAEIITRFHKDLGAGMVLTDSKRNIGAMDLIKKAEKEFMPPKLSDDAGNKVVSFYLLEPEEFVVYFVKATRAKDSKITVEKANL